MSISVQGAGAGFVGMLSLTAGGVLSALSRLSKRTRGIVRHVAAGTVFAGLVGDVLGHLLESKLWWWIGISAVVLVAIVNHLLKMVGMVEAAGVDLFLPLWYL